MKDDLAERVYPILQHAFELRDRLRRGERPALEVEQSVFLGLLGAGTDERHQVDFDGDRPPAVAIGPASGEPAGGGFLGARYALVCWLDELFVLDEPWAEQWNEHKLEVSLYASNDRAWRFWSQAKVAASRGYADALEVFYLCAMLGFRGEIREHADQLEQWFHVVREQIRHARTRHWDAPSELLPLPPVPALHGRRDLRVLLMATCVSALVLVPVVVLLLLRAGG